MCLCVKGFVAMLLSELRLIRKCQNHCNRHLSKPSAKRLKIIFKQIFLKAMTVILPNCFQKSSLWSWKNEVCPSALLKKTNNWFLKIQQFKPMEWILMYRLQINTNLFAGSSLATLSLLYEWCRITQTFTWHITGGAGGRGGGWILHPSYSALKSGKSWNLPQARRKIRKNDLDRWKWP